ncbi:MAG TPA: hypothetical protein VH277_07155, partial [Gemmatimonadaceae bacterium]|nr:hypothetical protein [Gemmatimonadaceae bacterium]
WQQQQSFIEGGGFGGGGNGIFKSTDGGDHWTQLTDGLPSVIQANLGISASNPQVLNATAAGTVPDNGGGRGGRGGANNTTGVVGFYKSTDGGAHWAKIGNDPRPLVRIGGGDLPTIAVDPKNDNVIYSASTVSWRTEDGGQTWSALRGAPGGDDYQKIWVNPINTNIILIVSDQGGVVSANRGLSWSNWYTQPTAAMYHVSVDNSYPFNVCGGQQDSGSACVASMSMDGEITFHDWHPVNIQEYGVAAPDPHDPDLVYGSARNGVSLYNRRTGQTTQVGPTAEQRGTQFGRNVRTMPIQWSPVDNNTLFYASNVVWKSTDHAHSWTRISPDLARQTWDVPATAGKYASTVTPSPAGSVTALSASPRSLDIIWTGTDDGVIQVTTDGGAHWSNVTPPGVKPWARVFNIEAGHFDNNTAYAAVNTMRLDDMNPHFFRTHDGGRTWTEINTGLPGGAVSNAIREDPRQRGVLYAATETQVWESGDDGDHWRSIKFDMPAIAVRDIQVKDDSTCMCADLVAGTHGRGFWILDAITPFRQEAGARGAQQAGDAYLFRPTTAVRVRFGTNDPTPWPPELPAGENPLPGGIIDYNLGKAATAPVRLEVLDAAGNIVRHYTSATPVRSPHPALDPEAYNELCKRQPNAPDCNLPLYWPAPPIRLGTSAGFHRFAWDLRYDPTSSTDPNAEEDDAATGAVPHRTYAVPYSPWAPPGTYTVKLTVDGKTYTQPLTLRLDPRVKTPAAGLAQLASLTKEMYDGAVSLHAAYTQARALSAALDQAGADAASLKAQVDELAPPSQGGGRRGRGGFGGGRGGSTAGGPPSLETVSGEMIGAAMAMQGADVTPTAGEVAAVAKARADGADAMKRWNTTKSQLASLNAKRKAAGQAAINP